MWTTPLDSSMWKQICLKQKQPGRCSIWWLLWQLKWKVLSQSEVMTNGQVSVGYNLSASCNTNNSESMTGWSSLRFSKCLHKDAPDVHEQVPSCPPEGKSSVKRWSQAGEIRVQCTVLFSSRSGSVLSLLGTRLILTLPPLHARYGWILLRRA